MLAFVPHTAPLPQPRSRLASSPRRAARAFPRAAAESPEDWRSFRARLVRAEGGAPPAPQAAARLWAHPVPFIERGALLLASPEHFTAQHACAFFANTLVFILDHTPASTAGLILNRPIARSLPELRARATLGLGGPVGLDTVVVLHQDASFGRPVAGGIRAAGLKDAVRRIEDGALDARQCRFFCGYSGWAPGQLQAEIDAGVWYTCAACDEVVMAQKAERGMLGDVLRLMGGRFGEIAQMLDERASGG